MPLFYDLDLCSGKPVKLIDELIDLFVRCIDLALKCFLFMRGFDLRQSFVQIQHLFDKCLDHLVVHGDIAVTRKID